MFTQIEATLAKVPWHRGTQSAPLLLHNCSLFSKEAYSWSTERLPQNNHSL